MDVSIYYSIEYASSANPPGNGFNFIVAGNGLLDDAVALDIANAAKPIIEEKLSGALVLAGVTHVYPAEDRVYP